MKENVTNIEKVNTLLNALNAAISEENPDTVIAQIKTELDTAISVLNDEERATTLADLAASLMPVYETCRVGMYALTSIVKDKKGNGYSKGEKYEIIDLYDLAKVKPEAFKNPQWIYYVEALNHAVKDYILAMQGITKKSQRLSEFKLSATAQILGISVKDTKTNKGMTAALQTVVDTILCDQTVTNIDAEALRLNYSAWGRAINGVVMPIETSFRKQITRILFRIINNEEFVGE